MMATALLAAACATEVPGLNPEIDKIRFPIGAAILPGDRYLLVSNSNFDLQNNGGTVVVVDTNTGKVLPEHTVKIGSFGGQIIINSAGTKAFIPVRNNNNLTVIDVDTTQPRFLKCGGSDAAGGLHTCQGADHIIGVSEDPFGIMISENGATETLFISHIKNGEISVVKSGYGGAAYGLVFNKKFESGINAMAVHPITGTIYVTSRFSANIYALKLKGATLELVDTLSISNATGGKDNRGLVFSNDGTRLFVSNRSPSSMLVFDTSVDEGMARNKLLKVIDVGDKPASIKYIDRPAPLRDLIYVACFGSGDIYVIDAKLLMVTDIIPIGNGPYTMIFSNGMTAGIGLKRAYVVNFREHKIAVVDLDETSANYNRVIAFWGTPL